MCVWKSVCMMTKTASNFLFSFLLFLNYTHRGGTLEFIFFFCGVYIVCIVEKKEKEKVENNFDLTELKCKFWYKNSQNNISAWDHKIKIKLKLNLSKLLHRFWAPIKMESGNWNMKHFELTFSLPRMKLSGSDFLSLFFDKADAQKSSTSGLICG